MHAPPDGRRHSPVLLAFAAFGALSFVAILVAGAFLLGRSQGDAKEPPRAAAPAPTGQLVDAPVTPVPTRPAVAPTAAPPTAAPPPPADERVMTAQHGEEYPAPLLFHYAHVGGRGIADVHGHLGHRDGRYFQLGPGDSLTLEAPEGQEFLADGTDAVFDLEIEVHPQDHASQSYEIDVSHAHLDVNGPWITLGHGDAHTWDMDHAQIRAARYVRIRNLDRALPLSIDGVYVRRMQACTDPSRCRDVNHLAPAR